MYNPARSAANAANGAVCGVAARAGCEDWHLTTRLPLRCRCTYSHPHPHPARDRAAGRCRVQCMANMAGHAVLLSWGECACSLLPGLGVCNCSPYAPPPMTPTTTAARRQLPGGGLQSKRLRVPPPSLNPRRHHHAHARSGDGTPAEEPCRAQRLAAAVPAEGRRRAVACRADAGAVRLGADAVEARRGGADCG